MPGARQAVERLRSRGLELRFVTKTTSHSHPVFLPSPRSSSAIERSSRNDASTSSGFCWTVNLRYFLVSLNATSGTGL